LPQKDTAMKQPRQWMGIRGVVIGIAVATGAGHAHPVADEPKIAVGDSWELNRMSMVQSRQSGGERNQSTHVGVGQVHLGETGPAWRSSTSKG